MIELEHFCIFKLIWSEVTIGVYSRTKTEQQWYLQNVNHSALINVGIVFTESRVLKIQKPT